MSCCGPTMSSLDQSKNAPSILHNVPEASCQEDVHSSEALGDSRVFKPLSCFPISVGDEQVYNNAMHAPLAFWCQNRGPPCFLDGCTQPRGGWFTDLERTNQTRRPHLETRGQKGERTVGDTVRWCVETNDKELKQDVGQAAIKWIDTCHTNQFGPVIKAL